MVDSSEQATDTRTAVILTALENEYQQVMALLSEVRVIAGASGNAYREGKITTNPDGSGDYAPWRVLIREGGRDQMNARNATEDAVRDWAPDVILFVGCAGGRPNKARHFEVLFVREVAYYEIAKVTPDGTRHWLKTAEAEGSRLFEAAKIERDELDANGLPAWTGRLQRSPVGNMIQARGIADDLRARLAPIASGEKVMTDPDGVLWNEIEEAAYRIEAVETEGYGFSFARCVHGDGRQIPRLMIRGISDMLGDKNLSPTEARKLKKSRPAYLNDLDDDDRQRIASAAASAFAVQVLVCYGKLYQPSNQPKPGCAPSKQLRVITLVLQGDDPDILDMQAKAIEHIAKLCGAEMTEAYRVAGSLKITYNADDAAIAILKALDESGLLSEISGTNTSIESSSNINERNIPDNIRELVSIIAGLNSETPTIRANATTAFKKLVADHPGWSEVMDKILSAADVFQKNNMKNRKENQKTANINYVTSMCSNDKATVREIIENWNDVLQSPGDGRKLGNLSVFLWTKLGSLDEVDIFFQRAITAEPKSAMSLGNFATYLWEVHGAHDEAEALYRRAIDAAPEHADILGNFANYLWKVRGAHDEAWAFYRRAIDVDPEHTNNLGNFAGFLLAHDRSVEGEEMWRQALTGAGNQPLGFSLELWFYAYAHLPDQHQRALEKVLGYLEQGVRSPGFDLSADAAAARRQGHPDPDRVEELARRISARSAARRE